MDESNEVEPCGLLFIGKGRYRERANYHCTRPKGHTGKHMWVHAQKHQNNGDPSYGYGIYTEGEK